MKYPTAALALVMGQMLFERNSYTLESSDTDFHLPDIPENERIKEHTQKSFKRGRRRKNKLHCRKRGKNNK